MASSQDGNLGLYSGYTPGDNGWTAQHNQNWDALDAFVQASVIDVAVTAPPGSPANGAAYVVPSGATGAWASQTNKVAIWTSRGSGQWTFYSPKNGWMVYSQATGAEYVYNGSAWALYYSAKLAVQQDYISGLRLIWNSATSISASTGDAYIPSLGRLSIVSSTLTLSSLSLTASTMYHIYLYESAGTPTIECVTAAPSSYFGTAYQKTGDNTRRYLGSIVTDASSNVLQFSHSPASGQMLYNNGINNGVLTAGTSTTSAVVSCSTYCPQTANTIIVRLVAANAASGVSIADGSMTVSGSNCFTAINPQQTFTGPVPLNSSQQIAYINSASGGATFIQAVGYLFGR